MIRDLQPSDIDAVVDIVRIHWWGDATAHRAAHQMQAMFGQAERCAKLVEGEVFKERYRTWPWVHPDGNRSNDSDIVKHCDAIAAAIRSDARAAGEERDRPHYYVAVEDDRVVGFSGFRRSWIIRGAWEVVWIAVAPSHGHRGIGHELLERGLSIIGRNHGSLIILMTEKPGFFEEFGFRSISDFNGWRLMTLQLTAIGIA